MREYRDFICRKLIDNSRVLQYHIQSTEGIIESEAVDENLERLVKSLGKSFSHLPATTKRVRYIFPQDREVLGGFEVRVFLPFTDDEVAEFGELLRGNY